MEMIEHIQTAKHKLKEAKDIIENNKNLGYVSKLNTIVLSNSSLLCLNVTSLLHYVVVGLTMFSLSIPPLFKV